jgi:CheY-like chemotaxis protein
MLIGFARRALPGGKSKARMTSLLVVEGNAEVRRIIRLLVEGLVDTLYEIEDAAKVSALYGESRFDWILIDLRLKEQSGLTATRQIKEIFPEAQIIIITEFDDEALREAASKVGANHYILKERLLDIVDLLSPRLLSGDEGL